MLARRLKGQGWTVAATFRDPAAAEAMTRDGVRPVPLGDMDAALTPSQAVLITAPPGEAGCPGFSALGPILRQGKARPAWTGYLSTTGTYGDRRGGWVFETSNLAAQSVEGLRRVAAERAWLALGEELSLAVTAFRLPGIYGPGRSTLDRLRAGQAKRIVSPGQVFSRIHVEDLAAGLSASIARPRAGGVYNLCDDEPAPNPDVVAHAAGLLGLPVPPEIPLADAGLSGPALRFYAESKRVSNARAKAELGWRPAYPTYREGLAAVLAAGG